MRIALAIEFVAELQPVCRVATDETALLVRSSQTGSLRLITAPGSFFPSPDEEVIGQRQRIRVAAHETVVLKDASGAFDLRAGDTSFFLAVDRTVHSTSWSIGPRATQQMSQQAIDRREQILTFEWEGLTTVVGSLSATGTISWQVVDVSQLLGATSDPSAEIWHRLQGLFSVEAAQFADETSALAGLQGVADAMVSADSANAFYSSRGVALRSVQLTEATIDSSSNAAAWVAVVAGALLVLSIAACAYQGQITCCDGAATISELEQATSQHQRDVRDLQERNRQCQIEIDRLQRHRARPHTGPTVAADRQPKPQDMLQLALFSLQEEIYGPDHDSIHSKDAVRLDGGS